MTLSTLLLSILTRHPPGRVQAAAAETAKRAAAAESEERAKVEAAAWEAEACRSPESTSDRIFSSVSVGISAELVSPTDGGAGG